MQARYDELAKYYYRFERSYYDSLDYGHGRGSRLARSYHELNIAFEMLSNSYMIAQSGQRSDRDQRAYAPSSARRQWQPAARSYFWD